MSLIELVANPAFPRSLVLGAFGGAGLALTVLYSRCGPLILPVYAAQLAASALLLARYPGLAFLPRLTAALSAFVLASAILYAAVMVLAQRDRDRLDAERQPSENAPAFHPTIWSRVWRLGSLTIIGGALCAGVAFIAG